MPFLHFRPVHTCFNCGEEHNIADCEQELDQEKIHEAKRKFFEERGIQM